MGYTPVFDAVFDGTLCGKWPDLPVWLTLLPLADRFGRIDMTMKAIAVRTGWPLEFLEQGIRGLCEPDPDSRSKAEDGRRLVLIDPERSWGWQVVNHERYREKARKASYDSARTASGLDAARKKLSREVPRSPDASRALPLSNGNGNEDSDKNKNKKQNKRARTRPSRTVPDDFVPDLAFARELVPDIDAEEEAKKFREWEFKTPKTDWDRTWQRWVRTCKERGEYAKKASHSDPAIQSLLDQGYRFA